MKDLEIGTVASSKFWGACGGKLQCAGESVFLLKVHSTTGMTSTEPYSLIATMCYLWVTQLASLSSEFRT